MKHLVIPTVNVFIFNGQNVLLGRRANTGWMDGSLCPPGGHVEKGETPVVAIIREIQEELGVTISTHDIQLATVAVRNTPAGETVAFEFTIHDKKKYKFVNAEPEKCSELIWVDAKTARVELIDQFGEIFEKGIIGKSPYLEIGY